MCEEKDKRTSIGAGITWAGLWLSIAIVISVEKIADKL